MPVVFTTTSPYVVGEPTAKPAFDKTHDNTIWLKERMPRVLFAGISTNQGYGTFRATNAAKEAFTIAAGTLTANGDSLRITAGGLQNSAAFLGGGVAIGTTDWYVVTGTAITGVLLITCLITRITATTVAVTGVCAHGDPATAETFGVASHAVSDLAANAVTLTVGLHSSLGAGTGSQMRGYAIEYVPALA